MLYALTRLRNNINFFSSFSFFFSVPIQMDVDQQSEPNIRLNQSSVPLQATVTVRGLTAGRTYTLYRYDGINSFPVKDFERHGGYNYKLPFVASDSTFKYVDPNTFLSNGAVYYIAVLSSSR